jgi:putative ABC transport system permease protein
LIRVVLRGLAGRKLRAALTALAIVLGVAMVSGTYVLTDSIKKGFDTIFTESYRGSDAVVTGKSIFGSTDQSTPPSFPESVLARIRALPEVNAAAGSVADQAQLVGRNGKVIVTGGAPNLAFSVDPKNTRFNPLTLVRGRWPTRDHEIAIDSGTAKRKHFAPGDEIGVSARGPIERFRITGVAELGAVASIGGATLAIFDLRTAQRLLDKPGRLDYVYIAAKPGVSTAKLISAIRPMLPATAKVASATAQAASDARDTSRGVGFIQKFLLAFGGIALFVGSFVIANTLSITIAQRTRELATLRTIGASRRQVLTSVIAEALVVGILGAVAGLFLGVGLAKGLNAVFKSAGIDLPQAGLVFATRTIVVSLIVGIGVTFLAALRPAVRATRVPPIAAVREGATLPPGRFARWRPIGALVLAAAGIASLCYGLFKSGLGTTGVLAFLGIGCLLLFLGVALFSAKLVPPLATALGWPAALVGGVAARLARENAARNPTRTASTAAALMIGLALVTFVAMLAQGLRQSFRSSVDELFRSDYALTAQNNFTPIPPAAADALAKQPGVEAVASVRADQGRAYGKTLFVTASDPEMKTVLKLDWTVGSQAALGQLGADGAVVPKSFAKKHRLGVGSPVRMQLPSGRFLTFHVRGVFDPPNGGSPFGDVTMSRRTFDANYAQPKNLYTFVNVHGGVSDATTTRLKKTLKAYPNAKLQTESEFKDNQLSGLNQVLNVLYVLLALSIIVSLFGIVNTLVLSVFERTRELGMLRAIGTTRWQVRWMITFESVMTALIGAVLGLALGVILAGLIAARLDFVVFTLPIVSLIAFAVVAVIVGILAAIFPARRAARLNVLQALQYE